MPPAAARGHGRPALALLTSVLLTCSSGCHSHPASPATSPRASDGETIVLIRHGEKPPGGLGQLTCRGWNRALALPGVLLPRFGPPAAIFAPDPAAEVQDGDHSFSYVRPLATVEPLAVRLGLPVNTQIAYRDIDGLQRALLAPGYAHSTVLVAWEHLEAVRFAQNLLAAYGQNPSVVRPWQPADYDTIYVFHVAPGAHDPGSLTFEVQQENLAGSLSDGCNQT